MTTVATIFDLERFHDGPIDPAQRRAALHHAHDLAESIRRTNEFMRRCRVGKAVERRPLAQRIALEMARVWRLRRVVHHGDLLAAGFTRDELRREGAVARGIAAGMVNRNVEEVV